MPQARPQIEATVGTLLQATKPMRSESLMHSQSRYELALRETAARVKAVSRPDPTLSEVWAKLRYEHARALNEISRAKPDFLARALERHLPGMPASLDRIAAERILVERLLGLLRRQADLDPCMGTQPAILDAPFSLFPGETYTVTGETFGVAPGLATLAFDSPATTVPLTILAWSDHAATFQVPAVAPPGLALHALGQLRVQRGDGLCADSVRIEYRSPHRFLFAHRSASDAGIDPFSSYAVKHTFTSPVVPPRAEPHVAFDARPGAGEVALNLASSEFISFDDDPPSYDIIVPTFFTAARARQITVRVRDDWAWNYTLNADFYIVQPLDEIIGAGWTPL